MKEHNLFPDYPLPLSDSDLTGLKRRILARHRRNTLLRASAVILPLAAAFLFLALSSTLQPPSFTPPASVISETPDEAASPSPAAAVAAEEDGEKLAPVDFTITPSEGGVRLVWQDSDEETEYIVRKCAIRDGGFDCVDEAEVSSNVFEDHAQDTESLVVYRVFARRT